VSLRRIEQQTLLRRLARGLNPGIFGQSWRRKAEVTDNNMSKQIKIKWLSEPEEHDYPAAFSYLILIYDEKTAVGLVSKLKKVPISEFNAKDIFRASRLSLLGVSNSHVKTDRMKIKSGDKVSPLLLVRDPANGKVVIADGYHRMCAVYTFDEDAVIPCKIA
jgi:hypothetical protein